MEGIDLITMVLTAIITGGVSTLGTVSALRVHIKYLGDITDRHEKSIERAHVRIDELKDLLNHQ